MEIDMLPLTKTLKIENSTIEIPELEEYKGKVVELTIKEKKQEEKQDLSKFFALCGKIDIDYEDIEKLREASYI
jgi:hypothetical protein